MRKVLKVKVIQPWIPVTERLPEPLVNVLVYYPDCKGEQMKIDFLDHDGFFLYSDNGRYFGQPTHWMPLPEVPHE